MNTDLMFSSKTDMWETPQDFFDKLNDEFHFTLDACATPENAKCARFYTKEQDSLSQKWDGVVWCNPPYCRQTGKWVEKAYNESKHGVTVVMLIPCRPDVSYFHDFILGKAEVRFVRGRLKFGRSKNSAPFPSMVVVFGEGRSDIFSISK